MRGLAQRSAQSAKEIKTLISESVAEIRGGSTLVEQAAAAAASLHQQTQQLKQAVSVFEISETVLRTQQPDQMCGPIAEFGLSRMHAN